ncbi:MAG: F0F1 ATP synthase subunit epsilon [Dehalococcoidia bacterium]
MSPLKLEIVTAEQVVYSDEVDMVIAPGIIGELGILPRHAPLITALQPGELRVKKGTEEVAMAVSGGFLEVFNDKLTILADAAERAEEIDLERAQQAMQRAEERVKSSASDVDLAQALAALRRSRIRLKVAGRRARRGSPGQPRSNPSS